LSASKIVNKVWNYAHVLHDDGVDYGDYVELITYLIFLKMADERERGGMPSPQHSHPSPLPGGERVKGVANRYAWANLIKLDSDGLELQYCHTLGNLGKQGGMLGAIFRKARNKIGAGLSWLAPCGRPPADQIFSWQICHSPAKLERLI